MAEKSFEEIADKLAKEVLETGKPKYLKVHTLLGRFNYERRTEDNAARITELLGERNILLNPSIMKFGETYPLSIDERVYLVARTEESIVSKNEQVKLDIYDYKNDIWFTDLLEKKFRTEKEVETKFIIPLLHKLGYTDDDRYDGMPVPGKLGSKKIALKADLVSFNSKSTTLNTQALLVVEAKIQDKLNTITEIKESQDQVTSYSFWLSCHFGLITDSKLIQVIDLVPTKLGSPKVLFSCNRNELQANFDTLYALVSKESLTNYYERIIQ